MHQARDVNRDSGRSKSSGLRVDGVSHRLPSSQRLSHEQGSAHSRLGEKVWVEKGTQSQVSHTPPPRLQREAMGASQEVNSSNDRRSALERLALPSNHPLPTKEPIAMTLEAPDYQRTFFVGPTHYWRTGKREECCI
ncbi:hypothetical protein YC2023_019504 [Brassica napus]